MEHELAIAWAGLKRFMRRAVGRRPALDSAVVADDDVVVELDDLGEADAAESR